MSGKQFAAWTAGILLLIAVFSYNSTDAHEHAHAAICEMYYGQVTEMNVTVFNGGSMQCVNVTMEHFDSYSNAQAQVEAFGYQLKQAVMAIIMAIWMLGTLYIMKEDYYE